MFGRFTSPKQRRRHPFSISLMCNEKKTLPPSRKSTQGRTIEPSEPQRASRWSSSPPLTGSCEFFLFKRFLHVPPCPRGSVRTPAKLHVCGSGGHTNPGFTEDLKHLGQPFVPFVCRHLKGWNNQGQRAAPTTQQCGCMRVPEPTWDGRCGNRVKPAVFGPCPRWTPHTCRSRAPAPPRTGGTSPPALGAPPAAPGFDRCPHSGSAPLAYRASDTKGWKTLRCDTYAHKIIWFAYVCVSKRSFTLFPIPSASSCARCNDSRAWKTHRGGEESTAVNDTTRVLALALAVPATFSNSFCRSQHLATPR